MICGTCGKAGPVHKIRDVPHVCKDQETIIRNIKGKWCPECDAHYVGLGECDDVMAAMKVFNACQR